MAAESNGRGADPGKNGHIAVSKSKTTRPNKGYSLFSIISRLLTWYSIFTIIFRCPATVDLLTESSPKICKPYFQLRSAVAPHLEPYYVVYAAPYVDVARPYYKTLDRRVITPAKVLGTKYGAPRVAQAQAYGQAQWEKNLQPQVLKYQGLAKEKYNQILAPHLEKVVTTLRPYYDIARTNALQTYYGHILPTYTVIQPYALQGYGIASEFTLNTAIPYSKWAWATGRTFFERTVFPKIRILYGENVEPQLVRIGERLGRYRDGKKLKAAIDEIARSSASSASSASSSFSSVSTSISATHATTPTPPMTSGGRAVTSTSSESVVGNYPSSEQEIREKAQKVVANDLKTWQEKFAKAADEGSDYLEERIIEITDRLIQNQAQKVGTALNIQLEETVKSSLENLKSTILSIVESSNSSEEKEESLNSAVRKAGISIKEKAQAVRTWRQSYDRETNSLVSTSAADTFEILDHIRDLGLQEIGMRWAWTDGITHRDWAKYHKLKTKFDEWRLDVEKIVAEHPGVEKARAAAREVENQAMGTAEEAAKELARIKETGRWKIHTNDSSDDWSTKTMPVAAAIADQEIKESINEASEADVGTSQGTMESVASVASSSVSDAVFSASSIAAAQVSNAPSAAQDLSKSASSVASSLSSNVRGTQQGDAESITSVAKETASTVADEASDSIIGGSQESVEDVSSIGIENASNLSAEISSSVVGTGPEVLQEASSSIRPAVSVVSDSASSLSSDAGSSISSVSSKASESTLDASSSYDSASSTVASSVSKSASDASSSLGSAVSSASSTASNKVWGGAMAQSVEAKQIVFEDVIEDRDEDSFSENIQSMVSEAGDKFGDITKAVSEALLKPTSTGGTVETLTVLAADQYSSALSAASVALYGTEKGTGESISSVVTSRYADAVSAASVIIHGTPTPLTNAVHSSADSAFSVATAAADSDAQAAFTTASSAYYGPPQGAIESISSVASSKLSQGLSAASAHFENGKSYINAISTGSPEKQKLLSQMQNQYYAGVGMAHARYSEFIDAASSAIMPTQTPLHESISSRANESISSAFSKKAQSGASEVSSATYGTETPVMESVASAASSNWEALITKASLQVYGQPTPDFVTRSLLSEAGEYAMSAADSVASQYSAVTDGVASQYSAVQSLISELVSGKEPDFTGSVYSRLSSAYYTGATDAASSASSYASEVYASATSVVGSVFTPPPAIEAILDAASSRVNDAVEAASIQFYGTPKGAYEQASSSAASAYSSIQSVVSEKVYGTQTGYAEAAQSSIAEAASSAQRAISEAIYGTSTGTYESATSAIGEAYASATSYVGDSYASASIAVSSAIHGPEQGAVQSAQRRLGEAVESARVKLAEFATAAGEGASEAVRRASEGVEEFASSVSSAVNSASSHVKDEL